MIKKFQSCYMYICKFGWSKNYNYVYICVPVQPYLMDGFGDWKATLEENLIKLVRGIHSSV